LALRITAGIAVGAAIVIAILLRRPVQAETE
jgi:hypothetical protein